MNIYDFMKMYSYSIEHAKRKRHERREIRKAVMERKRRKARNDIADNSHSLYYFEKGKLEVNLEQKGVDNS